MAYEYGAISFFKGQTNLFLTDKLCSGHLVIAESFSWNLPNLGQTLTRKPLCSGLFYSEQLL